MSEYKKIIEPVAHASNTLETQFDPGVSANKHQFSLHLIQFF